MEPNYVQGAKLKHGAILNVWEGRKNQAVLFNPFLVGRNTGK